MSYYLRIPRREQRTTSEGIWQGCLPEVPACTHPGCTAPAATVDPFFPYLDDQNRCTMHGTANALAVTPPLTADAIPTLLN